MQTAVVVVYLGLCISAPWISRRWGPRGEWAWFFTTISFIFATLLILREV